MCARFVRQTGPIVAAGVLAFAPTAAGNSRCPPAASVEGPPAIARPIANLLLRDGVGPPASPCAGQVVRAYVSDRPDFKGYLLRVEDRFGRSNERQVANAETATSLIESWVFDEDADLVAARSVAVVAKSDPTPAASPRDTAAAAGLLMGAAEVSATSDGAAWWGGSVGGCLRAGAFCVGGRARFARTDGVVDPFVTVETVEMTRTAVGALAFIALPLRHRWFTLSPALGLGAEWVHAAVSFAPVATASSSDVMLRADGALIATVPVTRGWSVLGELGGSWGPSLSTSAPQGTAMFWPTPPPAALRAGLGIGFSR